MKKHARFFLLPLIVALAIISAFVITAPVYAQDDAPAEPVPVDEPLTEEVPAEEVPTEEFAPVLEEAAEAGVTLVDENGEPLPLASEETAEALVGGDPWYKVGTTTYHFVFIGQCAILYPGEIFPYCQESTQPIQTAINYVPTSGLPSDGMIYVEAGNYIEQPVVNGLGATEFNFIKGLIGTVKDGAPQVNLTGDIWVNNVDLGFTITGFNIIANHIDPFAGIYIMDSTGAVKIEDVTVRNTGTGPGIRIVGHNGTVTLNRVKSDNNPNGGAYIDNTAGSGGVTITGSSFNYNDEHASYPVSGLTIYTKGALTVDGITASNNDYWPGLYIVQSGAITIKNSVFNYNTGSFGIANSETNDPAPAGAIALTNVYAMHNTAGLWLNTKGNMTLTGVHAGENNYQGATLNTCYEKMTGACTWLGTGKVTIKDSTFSSNNSNGYGLSVESRGAISLTNVSANQNNANATTDGARFYAQFSQLASAVTVTNSTFNNNGNNGLRVFTKGTITLNKVKAIQNVTGYGAELNNTYDTSASTVTVTGSVLSDNQFDSNGSTGLEITSNGAVTVKYADGSNNDGSGLAIFNTAGTGSVSVSKGTFGWWMGGNAGAGIEITTKGNVTVSDVTATGYGSDGLHVFIDPALNSTATITNSDFLYNGLNGLDIEGRGTITLTKVYASGNLNLGAELAAFKVGNIIIKDSSFDYNGDHPYDYGLHAYSAEGTITLTNVSASWNSGTGAYITNSDATSAKAVSITGGNFNYNNWTGLKVYSKGAITLKNVNAYENNESNIDIVQDQRIVREVVDGTGADLFTFQSISGTVNNLTVIALGFTPEMWLTGCTAATTHYWDGDGDGIVEHDYGAVNPVVCTLHVIDHYSVSGGAYEVHLNGSYDATEETYGAYLDNTAGTAGISIINTAIPASEGPLDYYRDFTRNTYGGLELHTNGAVTLSNLILDDNGGYGVRIFNDDGEATHATNVTMSNIYANENYWSGIWVVNKGSITMTNVASWGHMIVDGYGAFLDNDAGTGSITIKNTITMPFGFDENHARGLNIFTNGKVSITKVQMNANDEDGIRVWQGLTGPTEVTLTNCVMNNNVAFGASIRSYGPIVVTGSTFNDNAIAAHFDNTDSGVTSPKPVTLNKVTAEDNPAGGIEIDTYGAVSLSNVTVDGSNNAGVVGIDINNYMGPYGVTLTEVTSNDSGNVGIFVITNGALTYKGGELKDNGSDGISIYAGPEAIAKAITLADLYIFNNDGWGADIYNQGTITLTNVRSNSNNSGWGMWLDNTACGTATPCIVNLLTSGKGFNEFSNNSGGDGLRIYTYGVIVMNKVSASGNTGYGVRVYNNSADVAKPVNVTVTGGTFSSNSSGTGLYVLSRGIITVNGVEASSNQDGYYGAYLNNLADTSGNKGVNVLKSKFNTNTSTGLYIRTYGAVVLNTNEAVGNTGGMGVDVGNNYAPFKPVSILSSYGTNNFSSNNTNNLAIASSGVVTVSKVIADYSVNGAGIYINNWNNTTSPAVTLTNVSARYNGDQGVYVSTYGNVTITGITSMFNGITGEYDGLSINTNDNPAAKVTIKNGLLTSNTGYGIRLNLFMPGGLYSLANVFYFGNDSNDSGNSNLLVY